MPVFQTILRVVWHTGMPALADETVGTSPENEWKMKILKYFLSVWLEALHYKNTRTCGEFNLAYST